MSVGFQWLRKQLVGIFDHSVTAVFVDDFVVFIS
jgi:hypothetical protein